MYRKGYELIEAFDYFKLKQIPRLENGQGKCIIETWQYKNFNKKHGFFSFLFFFLGYLTRAKHKLGKGYNSGSILLMDGSY